ncbi:MAG: 6,7-dimethyl-8-ribityllumazine synthase [Pseudomonadota bacterium]
MPVITANPIKEKIKLALVLSEFNTSVTERLYEGAINRLKLLRFDEDQYTTVKVPGAIEIPLVTQRLAASKQYHAIVMLGAVIRGETTHYDYVCQQVSQGCQTISLKYDLPVIFGILTTENKEQALARCGGKKGDKGSEAVDTALAMISIMQQI